MCIRDSPGAYPGIDAEERGQSEAIGRNLYVMAELKVPVIVTIIGEGGSGGALAIAVGDTVQMLQYSTYSVISPEGCASILWKSADKAPEAAETMGITAQRLKTLGLIDKIVSEPLGGAHRDHAAMAQNLKKVLQDALKQLLRLWILKNVVSVAEHVLQIDACLLVTSCLFVRPPRICSETIFHLCQELLKHWPAGSLEPKGDPLVMQPRVVLLFVASPVSAFGWQKCFPARPNYRELSGCVELARRKILGFPGPSRIAVRIRKRLLLVLCSRQLSNLKS